MKPGLKPAVEGVILKALAKDPTERYQSAGKITQAFQAALDAPATVVPPESQPDWAFEQTVPPPKPAPVPVHRTPSQQSVSAHQPQPATPPPVPPPAPQPKRSKWPLIIGLASLLVLGCIAVYALTVINLFGGDTETGDDFLADLVNAGQTSGRRRSSHPRS